MKRQSVGWAVVLGLFVPLALLPACGSEDPVLVPDGGGLGGEETRRPGVPRPTKNADGTYDIPDVSDVISIVRPLTSDLEEYVMGGFSPIIESAKADWVVRRQDCRKPDLGSTDCGGTYEVINLPEVWSEQIGLDNETAVCGHIPGVSSEWRHTFIQGGETVEMNPDGESFYRTDLCYFCCDDTFLGCVCDAWSRVWWMGQIVPLAERPYLKRERYWVASPITDTGVGSGPLFWIIDEAISSKTFSATYTRGVETTETRTTSFALAVSAEGSLSQASKLKSIAGSLSGSYTQSSESSKTVSEATETQTTTTIEGIAGKEIVLQVWHLVERYTITDKNGDPYQDPNYRFKDEFFILSGVAVKDQTTIFDK
jgi:hypothetical protein